MQVSLATPPKLAFCCLLYGKVEVTASNGKIGWVHKLDCVLASKLCRVVVVEQTNGLCNDYSSKCISRHCNL